MLTKKKVITNILLIAGILILVNFFANRFFLRLDFTEDQQYTLSKATKNILKSLTDPVTVTAYFSEDLPPDIMKVKKDFKDLLIEYNNVSGGKIVYQFLNPNIDQESEMEAQQAGIQPVMINVRERDQMKQQRAYLGAVLQYAGKKEIIPLIQPGSAMEFSLSTNIKKLSLTEKIKIAFLQGSGEPSLSEIQQLNQQLSIMYDVQTTQLDSNPIPNDYKTLIILAPSDTVNPGYLKQLDDFLAKGGRILIALNRVKGDLSNATGSSQYTGFEDWLNKKGIEIEDNFIIDANSGNIMVRQQTGMFVMNTPVKFPYLPLITKFTDHPITKGIESVLLPFASPIKILTGDSALQITKLAFTSDKSGYEKPPIYFDVMRQWNKNDFPATGLTVAAAIEGKIVNDVQSKIVIFGDGDFVINGSGQNAQRLQDDNINLMVNAIDWLSDDTGLIDLRTKGVSSRPINADMEDGTKTFLKYLNFLLPIILIIGFGIIRLQFRKRQRSKWMNEDYV